MSDPTELPSGPRARYLQNSGYPLWVSGVVIVGAVLLAAGAVIAVAHPALLVSPTDQVNGAVRVYAGYLFSRNLAIAAMLIGTWAFGSRAALSNLLLLTAVVQFLDAGMDGVEGRFMLVPGVALLGIAFAGCALRTRVPLSRIPSVQT